jgi:hypothetical protein
LKTQTVRNQPLKTLDLSGFTIEEIQLILLGSYGALQPSEGVAREQIDDSVVSGQEFFGCGRKPLPEGRGLRNNVVSATSDHQRGILG